jgi:hypothetical protein
LNGVIIAGTLLGLVLQGWVGRLRTKSAEPKVEKKKPAPLLVAVEPDEPEPKKAGWKLIPWKRDAA